MRNTTASGSLIGRWLSARNVPFTAPDSSELDLGYESALPWFATEMEETAPEPLAER